jgi:hypothetical protein
MDNLKHISLEFRINLHPDTWFYMRSTSTTHKFIYLGPFMFGVQITASTNEMKETARKIDFLFKDE